MATVITYDRRGFEGHVFESGGKIVCVLASASAWDTGMQARIRRLMQGQGIDCLTCGGCPVGRQSQ